MTNDVNDGKVENIQRIAFVSTAGVAFGMRTIDGKIRTAVTPYGYDVAEGNIANHNDFFRIGFVGLLPNTSWDMWGPGGNYVYPPSTGIGFRALSASTLDVSSNGTGIKTVTVDYLDTNYIARSTTLTLTTAVATAESSAKDAMRFNSLRANTVGTLGKAAGAVSIVATSASTDIYRQIASNETRGRSIIFTVPEGQTLYITDISGGIGTNQYNKYVRAKLVANWDGVDESTKTFFTPLWEQLIQGTPYQERFDIPLKFPEHTDIKMVLLSNESSGILVNASIRGWIETP